MWDGSIVSKRAPITSVGTAIVFKSVDDSSTSRYGRELLKDPIQ
jgi:hypothetical protein